MGQSLYLPMLERPPLGVASIHSSLPLSWNASRYRMHVPSPPSIIFFSSDHWIHSTAGFSRVRPIVEALGPAR